jgi:transposase
MKVFDEIYKERAVSYFEETGNRRLVIEAFNISYNTLCLWIKQKKEEKSLKPKPRPGQRKKFDDQLLLDYIMENPDARLKDMEKFMGCSETTILRMLKRLKISNKKNAVLCGAQRRKKAGIYRENSG